MDKGQVCVKQPTNKNGGGDVMCRGSMKTLRKATKRATEHGYLAVNPPPSLYLKQNLPEPSAFTPALLTSMVIIISVLTGSPSWSDRSTHSSVASRDSQLRRYNGWLVL